MPSNALPLIALQRQCNSVRRQGNCNAIVARWHRNALRHMQLQWSGYPLQPQCNAAATQWHATCRTITLNAMAMQWRCKAGALASAKTMAMRFHYAAMQRNGLHSSVLAVLGKTAAMETLPAAAKRNGPACMWLRSDSAKHSHATGLALHAALLAQCNAVAARSQSNAATMRCSCSAPQLCAQWACDANPCSVGAPRCNCNTLPKSSNASAVALRSHRVASEGNPIRQQVRR